MIVDSSLQIKRTAIAYLHAPIPSSGPGPQRQDNLQFYEKVLASGLDLPEMQQFGQEVVLLNRSGLDQITEVRAGNVALGGPVAPGVPVPAHFRLLFAVQNSNRPFKFTVDGAENCFEAARQVWGARLQGLTLVEVSMVATAQLRGAESAAAVLRDRVTRVGEHAASRLGRQYDHVQVKLGSGTALVFGAQQPGPAMPGASVELTLEPIEPQTPENEHLVQVVLLCKWPALQLNLRQLQIPQQVRDLLGGKEYIELNQDVLRPDHYISQVYNYLQSNVLPFLDIAGRESSS